MLHGRLYGAFWIALKRERRRGLTINGESIADLDYGSMFPRIAYALVGREPPQGDLYAIPGLEKHRAGVKAGLSALLSSPGRMLRLPADVKDKLPRGWNAKRFKGALAEKHPALMFMFGSDQALDLMFYESCLLVDVLLTLSREGIAALPMHDGMMVAQSHAARVNEVMEERAKARLGAIIPVSRKV